MTTWRNGRGQTLEEYRDALDTACKANVGRLRGLLGDLEGRSGPPELEEVRGRLQELIAELER